ncbi:maturation protein, partial [ssRNA phage Gerhypos.2_40]
CCSCIRSFLRSYNTNLKEFIVMSIPTNLLDDPRFRKAFGRFKPRKKRKRGGPKRTRLRKHMEVRVKLARLRSRSEPNPFTGMVGLKTGQIFIEDGPGTSNWKPYGSPRNDAPSYPYLSAESCADELHGTPPWKNGGPFRKIEIGPVIPFDLQGAGTYITSSNWSLTPYFGRVKYVGGFAPPDPFPGSHEAIFDLKTALSATSSLIPGTSTLEAQVWDRTRPKLETGGLFVALAEAKDTPRMLQTSARGFRDLYLNLGGNPISQTLKPKKVADHFLNHSFGWVPFVQDVVALCDNIVNADKKFEKISKDNGQDVRRRATMIDHTETITLGGDDLCLVSPGNIAFLQNCLVAPPRYEVTLERKINAHSVGRFRYYNPYFDMSRPEAQSWLGSMMRQLTIHGARVSPANVYKAIKWTWLIDWVSNTGKIVNQFSDGLVDNMAATYLFFCHTQELTYHFRQIMPFNAASGGTKIFEWTRRIYVNQRKEADSPLGFGLTWENLGPKQLALLAALGLSRSKIPR